MTSEPTAHIGLEMDGDIAIVHILSREIRHPGPAVEMGEQLASVLDQGHERILINFKGNRYLCSTAFATLVNVAKKVQAAGGQIKACCLDPDVQVGAQILGLGRFIEIHETERAALDSF
jgi:anti-sigma B factor antagonist